MTHFTNCPFCNYLMDQDRGDCPNRNCSYNFETYVDWDLNKPTNIDYDVHVKINGVKYLFTSAKFQDGTEQSKLYDIDRLDVLASISIYTEPTIEIVESMAQRLHKLLVFS